ncbi:MAG: dihydrolipoamide acetyltransferase family protein [Dehalococcoidia bacterium]
MAREVVMPRLSDTMEEGKILKWHKRPGDPIAKGELLAEIETDKANMELEAYDTGVLTKIVVDEGGQAPIGQPIAFIGAADEVEIAGAATLSAPAAPVGVAPTPLPDLTEEPEQGIGVPAAEHEIDIAPIQPSLRPAALLPPEPAPPAQTEDNGRIKASPLARKIAAERGIDLSLVKGSGPAGRILREDVEAAGAGQPVQAGASVSPAPRPATEAGIDRGLVSGQPAMTQPLTRMQQTIAKRMASSKQQVPHFYVTTEIDTGELTELRQRLNAAGDAVKVSYNDLIVKAVALALAEIPLLNSSWRNDAIHQNHEINIGIAQAVERGLLVPVIQRADQKGIRQIARENAAMFNRVRENKPRPEDFQGATFTISNLGMYDVDEFSAIVDQPAAAILAIASIRKKPAVIDDQVVVRERMRVTISADHRVVYGAEAAQFLQAVKRRLENPYSLID